jgi:hypothetical protein
MSTYTKENRNSRKSWHKLEVARKIDGAISEMRRNGIIYFSSKIIAEKSKLSYRTVLRYVDKKTLHLLQTNMTSLAEILFGA